MKTFFYGLMILWVVGIAVPLKARAVEVQYGGEFRVRGFYDNNLTDANSGKNDQEAFSAVRFRLKISATEGLATGVVLVDFFNSLSNQDVATLNTTPPPGRGTGNRTLGSEGFGRSLDSVALKEGYLRVSWPVANVVVGRQAITLGHGLILDDTADAFSVAIPIGWVSLTFADILLDTTSRGSQNTSIYLSNLNLAPSAYFGSSLFALLLKDRGPNLSLTPNLFFHTPCDAALDATCALSDLGTDQALLATLGWTMDYKGPAFQWATEANYLKGSIKTHGPVLPNNPLGHSIDLRGANAFGRFGWSGSRMDATLTGLYSTGQKIENLPPTGRKLNINAISPNFVLGNILVNNETVSDRDGGNIGGLTAAKLAVGWRPTATIRGELAGIWARLTQRPGVDASRGLGWELDANAFWQLDPRLLLTGGFGMLFTGDAWMTLLSDPEATDRMIKLSTKLIYTF